jgi:hypothetical protein
VSALAQVFSSGGGTQSAAISALIVQGRLPRPDYVVIVDTERERGTTWEYLDSVIRPAFASIGIEVHRIRRTEWASYPEHGMDWLSHNRNTVLIPAFTTKTEGGVSKLDGFCSKTWKVEVCDRFMSKNFGVTRSKYCKWIGFSLNETKRAIRMMQGAEYKAGLIRFPLIHDIPVNRYDAIRLVEDMGWPTPPRSACWMCPNQLDDEWSSLTQEEFAAAVQLEKDIQKVDPFAWLHKSGKPLEEVDFSREPELNLGEHACSSGACFV